MSPKKSDSSSKKFSSSPWMLLSCSSMKKSSLRYSPRMILLSVSINSSCCPSPLLPSITIETVRWIIFPSLPSLNCELDMLRLFLERITGRSNIWSLPWESVGEEEALVLLRCFF